MKLEHYPAWLREEIAPTNPTKSILCDMQENEKALRHIYESYRLEPVKRILFMLVIEMIRNKINIDSLEKRVKNLQEEVDNFKREHQ